MQRHVRESCQEEEAQAYVQHKACILPIWNLKIHSKALADKTSECDKRVLLHISA